MKQKLHIFMTLLLLMICGGVSFGQDEVTYTVASTTSVTASKEIEGVTYTFNNTYTNNKEQLTSGKSMTLTLKGYPYVIKQLKLKLHRNNSKGLGTLAVTVGNKSIYTKTFVKNDLTSTYAEYAFDVDSYTIAGDVVITLAATENSLYCNSFTIVPQTDDKASTKLSFGTDYDGKTITKKVGDIYKALATLTPSVEGATITYKSSDATVAEVADGVVEAKKEGTATITATYAGNDSYRGSSASYTIKVEKIATTLSFPNKSYSFIEGDQNGTAAIEDNAAVLSPEGAGDVTYSVKGTEGLAKVMEDGSVLVNTNIIGTATITASFAGNDKYVAATDATYTIKVNKKVEDGLFDFSKPEDYGYSKPTSGGTTMSVGTEVKAGNVTLTILKKGGNNDAKWWYDGAWRIYKGSEHKLSVPEGYLITSVTIVPESSYANYKLQGGAAGKDWTGASQEVSIVNDGSASRIKSITVKYTKVPTLTTAASGFATYAADYDVDYSAAGLIAYAITLDDAAKTVKYTEATGVVPAGKAVLVKGEAKKEYTLAPATEAAADFATDLLISDGTVTTEGGLYYAFATVDGKSGFKKLADGLTIPAKKGYLKLSAASAKGFFAFDETTTGINEIEAEAAQDNAAIYNLAGQRVSKEYKGVVIKNGKKFLNK